MKSLWGQSNRYLRIKRANIDISPKWARLVLLTFLALIILFFLVGDVGLWNLWKAKRQLSSLQTEIMELETKNELLKAEIERLESDSFTIEKVAREKYGYVKPGDKVYRIVNIADEEKEKDPTPLDNNK